MNSRMESFVAAVSADFPRYQSSDVAWWKQVWNAVGDGDRDHAQLSPLQIDFTLLTLDLPSSHVADEFMLSLSFAKRTSQGIQLDAHMWAVRNLKIEGSSACAVLMTCPFLAGEIVEVTKKASEKGYKVKAHSFGDESKQKIELAKEKMGT